MRRDFGKIDLWGIGDRCYREFDILLKKYTSFLGKMPKSTERATGKFGGARISFLALTRCNRPSFGL